MCSARWEKRKANNGPTGNKASAKVETDTGPMSEAANARRLFGDMADDILLLRKRGHTVARFKDGFRVDRDVLTAEQLVARAKVLRERPTKYKAGPEQGELHESQAPDDAPQAERQEPPATSPRGAGPRADTNLPARLSQLEQRVEFLFAVVADAIKGRRESLAGQVAGLAKLEAELRDGA